jgi:hypothetical protein
MMSHTHVDVHGTRHPRNHIKHNQIDTYCILKILTIQVTLLWSIRIQVIDEKGMFTRGFQIVIINMDWQGL